MFASKRRALPARVHTHSHTIPNRCGATDRTVRLQHKSYLKDCHSSAERPVFVFVAEPFTAIIFRAEYPHVYGSAELLLYTETVRAKRCNSRARRVHIRYPHVPGTVRYRRGQDGRQCHAARHITSGRALDAGWRVCDVYVCVPVLGKPLDVGGGCCETRTLTFVVGFMTSELSVGRCGINILVISRR